MTYLRQCQGERVKLKIHWPSSLQYKVAKVIAYHLWSSIDLRRKHFPSKMGAFSWILKVWKKWRLYLRLIPNISIITLSVVMWPMATTNFALYHSGDGFLALINRQPVREIEYLTVTQINENCKPPTDQSKRKTLPSTDRGKCCYSFDVSTQETEM